MLQEINYKHFYKGILFCSWDICLQQFQATILMPMWVVGDGSSRRVSTASGMITTSEYMWYVIIVIMIKRVIVRPQENRCCVKAQNKSCFCRDHRENSVITRKSWLVRYYQQFFFMSDPFCVQKSLNRKSVYFPFQQMHHKLVYIRGSR